MSTGNLGQKNYYELLEVSPNASQEVLKAAYKSLMQRHHPDRNPGNAEAADHAALIVKAYTALSDSGKRAAYDAELKWQSANLRNGSPTRAARAAAPAGDAASRHPWLYLTPIALLLLALWLFWPTGEIRPPDSTISGKVVSSIMLNQPEPQAPRRDEHPAALATKTIPLFIENLKVDLAQQADPAGTAPAAPKRVLSIKAIGVVVGAFDSDRFVSLLERNKDYIGRELAGKLVGANHEQLLKHSGDRYLKQFILDAIGEITNTNRPDGNTLPATKPLAQYGAVDILLPESFTVEQH